MEINNLKDALSNPYFSHLIDTIKENNSALDETLQRQGDPNYDPNDANANTGN